MTALKNGYVAALELYNPDADLPEDYTLTLTFTSITGVDGNWKFDIPVKQLPSDTVAVTGEKNLKDNRDYSIQVDSIKKGKATTLLSYKTSFPAAGEKMKLI